MPEKKKKKKKKKSEEGEERGATNFFLSGSPNESYHVGFEFISFFLNSRESRPRLLF